VSGANLAAAVPGLDKVAQITAEQIASIGSQDMNDKVWFDLVARIKTAIESKEGRRNRDHHGTDTWRRPPSSCNRFLPPTCRWCWSARCARRRRSRRCPANLYERWRSPPRRKRAAAACWCAHDVIHGARWVQKTNTTSVDTFRSPDAAPVGYVDTASVRFLQPAAAVKASGLKLPAAPPLPRVDIIYSHAKMDAAPVEDAVKRGAKGIVLAGVGDGNTSKAAIDARPAPPRRAGRALDARGVGLVNRNVDWR